MITTNPCVVQVVKMLENLDRWLTRAEEFAKTKSFDANVLLGARLAPDQYTLTRQVQAACDAAKTMAARLSGQAPPAHPDTEATMAELHARLQTVIAYVKSVEAAAYEGAEARVVPLPFMPGKGMKGDDYLVELALPNFYFHVSMAYAILRNNGVTLGKTDFIGSLKLIDA
ncbi:MAG: DUF1993 domain-containing protein [Minicystis sp.]